MFSTGDLYDIRNAMQGLPCDSGAIDVIDDYIHRITSARAAILDFAKSSLAEEALYCTDNIYFDLFKTCYHLFTKRPEATVWQIGAGDGIANDRLR